MRLNLLPTSTVLNLSEGHLASKISTGLFFIHVTVNKSFNLYLFIFSGQSRGISYLYFPSALYRCLVQPENIVCACVREKGEEGNR